MTGKYGQDADAERAQERIGGSHEFLRRPGGPHGSALTAPGCDEFTTSKELTCCRHA